MNVQDLQVMRQDDFVHADGECEVIRRILEQWIASDIDFMEIDAWPKGR